MRRLSALREPDPRPRSIGFALQSSSSRRRAPRSAETEVPNLSSPSPSPRRVRSPSFRSAILRVTRETHPDRLSRVCLLRVAGKRLCLHSRRQRRSRTIFRPAAEEEDTVAERFGGSRRVVDRESDYSKRRFNRTLSPTRDEGTTTYAERVREAQLDRERDNTMRQIAQKQREEAERRRARRDLRRKPRRSPAVRARRTEQPPPPAEIGPLPVLGPALRSRSADRDATETWDDDSGKRAKTEASGGGSAPALMCAAEKTGCAEAQPWETRRPPENAAAGGVTGRRGRRSTGRRPETHCGTRRPPHFGAGC